MASLPWRGGLGSDADWRHERPDVSLLCDHREQHEHAPEGDDADHHA
jgi:hypothetical protein